MKFRRPHFDVLQHHFRTDPASAHLCIGGHLSGAPSPPETSAARMSEALVLAGELISDRASLLRLQTGPDGKSPLLGDFGYRTHLCPHGLARGASDLAHFLQEHWGRPANFQSSEEAPGDIIDTTGLIAFLNIDGVKAQGHLDLWDRQACLGHEYWPARKIWFWKLE